MNKIYIVQHCQSEHHVNELTGGWTDTPLTELGRNQAKAVTKELVSLNLTSFKLISSDLKRAFMTAEYIKNHFQVEHHVDANLREINNGDAKDKTKEWSRNNKNTSSKLSEIDTQLWDNAETIRELYNRMTSFIKNNIEDINEDIVIVSHGVAIGHLICSWLEIPVEKVNEVFIRGNAGGISCIGKDQFDHKILTQFNSMSHLRRVK